MQYQNLELYLRSEFKELHEIRELEDWDDMYDQNLKDCMKVENRRIRIICKIKI